MSQLPKKLQPAIKDIRLVDDSEVDTYLRGEFNFEAGREDTNSNFLMLLGEKARRIEPSIIEKTVMDWLNESANNKRAEVVGWFLFGYWTKEKPINEALAVGLVTALENPGCSPSVQAALPLTLKIAYEGKCSPGTKSLIRAAFLKLQNQVDLSKWSKSLQDAIGSVIGHI